MSTDWKYNEIDFILVTDGSGHVDGFGGWAAEIETGPTRPSEKHHIFGGAAGTGEVFRMELTGLISALTFIFNKWQFWQGDMLRAFRSNPLKIVWSGDNQALVRAVYRDPVTKQHANSRYSCPDLWRQFEWYESFVIIAAQFVEREEPIMQTVDWYASTNRRMCLELAAAAPLELIIEGTNKELK